MRLEGWPQNSGLAAILRDAARSARLLRMRSAKEADAIWSPARFYLKPMSIRRGPVRRLDMRENFAAMMPAARQQEFCDALHVYRHVPQPQPPDSRVAGGDAQAFRPRNQGRPHA